MTFEQSYLFFLGSMGEEPKKNRATYCQNNVVTSLEAVMLAFVAQGHNADLQAQSNNYQKQ
jgi:hypothetical protein